MSAVALPAVTTAVCDGCGREFEREPRRGRPRLYCETCRPPRAAITVRRARPARPPHPTATPDQQRLIEEHLTFARTIAWREVQPTEEYADVCGDAMVGLTRAAATYDPARGVPFLNWAGLRITGAIRDARRRNTWLPRRAFRDALALKRNGVPSAEWSEKRTTEAIQAERSLRVRSLDEQLLEQDGELLTVLDTVETADPTAEATVEVRELLAALEPRELLVVKLHRFWGLSLKEIGELLGVTESRVCQIDKRALKRMREHAGHSEAA